MAGCEKCWARAYMMMYENGKSQTENYHDLIAESVKNGVGCTPKEQAGEWWDEEKQKDKRDVTEGLGE